MWQSFDPVTSVKSIGLVATLVLLFIGGVGFIVRYFIKALDKKDTTIERKDGEIMKMSDARREDLVRMEARLRDTAEALKEATNNLRTGFDDLKREVQDRR
mgnify:CR=1 FL=1